jgi:quinol-cytochrome oxidoreductase complex cytochrome b subunit
MSNVPLGLFMRDLHKIGAEGMVAVVCLHMLRTFVTGNYKKPRQFTWFTGVVLLLVTVGLSFSGYLLPWDQLSLWAVTIGASMAEAAPTPWPLNILGQQWFRDPEFLGTMANNLLRGGPQFNANGLLRWYLGHVLLLPLIGFIFIGVHYYKVILHGHSLPPEAEKVGEDTAKRVPVDQRTYFMPNVLTDELFLVSLVTFLLVFGVTLGGYHAPLEPHADPLITPLHTTAPWYFLWLQGMLKLGDKVLWGVVAPNVIIGLLLSLPYVEVGPSRRYADRRIGLSVGMLVVIVLSILTFMGTPWYAVSSSVDQEIVATLLPQTHPGPLRSTHFDQLIPGQYNAKDWQSAPTAGLKELLKIYNAEIEHGAIKLKGVEGVMIIEDWQTGLKKITFRVVWNGGANSFAQDAYLHQDSNYGD